ncbi:MAG: hypothetical protein R6X33_07875 [Candidatus Brocadiia bacterium]
MKWKPVLYVLVLIAIVVLVVVALTGRKEEAGGGPAGGAGGAGRESPESVTLQYDRVGEQAADVPFDFLTGKELEGTGWVVSGDEQGVRIDADEPGTATDGAEIQLSLDPEAPGEVPGEGEQVTFRGEVSEWEMQGGKLQVSLRNGQVEPAEQPR